MRRSILRSWAEAEPLVSEERYNRDHHNPLLTDPLMHYILWCLNSALSPYAQESLGYVEINLSDVVHNGRINQKYHLIDSKNGKLHVELSWTKAWEMKVRQVISGVSFNCFLIVAIEDIEGRENRKRHCWILYMFWHFNLKLVVHRRIIYFIIILNFLSVESETFRPNRLLCWFLQFWRILGRKLCLSKSNSNSKAIEVAVVN